MKKLAIFFLLGLCANFVQGQTISEPYDYPIRPGTEEWKGAKNHDELRELNQIPSQIIQKMDTRTLLNSVVRYPLIGDILLFPSFSRGIVRLKEDFFAFDSLLSRSDVIEALMPVYEAYEPSKVNRLQDPIDIGEYMLGLSLLEFIISDRAQHGTINAGHKHRLSVALLLKYAQKEELVDQYGGNALSTCLWAANQLLADEAMPSEQWRDRFQRDGFVLDRHRLDALKREIEKRL